MTARDAQAFERCVAAGGVAVFPADTVYGLACDPQDAAAVERMYALKGRRPDKPAATMFFDLDAALAARPDLPARTRAAVERLLPGAVTVVLARGGLRVPRLEGPLAPLRAVGRPVLQTSANLAGGPDPTTVSDVPAAIRDGVDLVLDAGPLPGTPSTVVDLRDYADTGEWRVLRAGAMGADALAQALSSGAR
ncbi:MAG: L-threonylcarbamoyladenylate synthase [Solirubrobacteraceae bacterium]|nr:L-threonylcarbamoyladenylate synthase [Solirubrobacteraceae bacterium]